MSETTTLPSTLFRGIYVPSATWQPPVITEPLLSKAKAKRAEGEKPFIKYAINGALAMGLDELVEGMTFNGKPIRPEYLFATILEHQVEAEEAAAKRRAEAEEARKAHEAKVAKVAGLEVEMKKAIAEKPEAVTWTMLLGWATIAKESDAFLSIHGGEGEGAGLFLRFKGTASSTGAPRAPRATGGGNKGGTETRVSAYAEAKRFQKKGGAPHDITRTGVKGSYAFFDHGKAIAGPLSKYLQATYSTCPCSESLKGYDARRKEAKKNAAPST